MTDKRLVTALKAGSVYFALVFLAGFALGTIRVMFLAPRFGELPAVLLELPVMLWVAWFSCGWLIGRFDVSNSLCLRAVMGGVAFALLMLSEYLLATMLFGASSQEYFLGLVSLAGGLGLLGQILFASLPLLQK
jgi:hypothetical protein